MTAVEITDAKEFEIGERVTILGEKQWEGRGKRKRLVQRGLPGTVTKVWHFESDLEDVVWVWPEHYSPPSAEFEDGIGAGVSRVRRLA